MTELNLTRKNEHQSSLSGKGYFHLVGVIFTLWGKICPSEDKMK